MLNFFVGVVALSLLIDANASCPNLDDVANGSFVTDRFVATPVETYADLAVALSCLYDDVANGQDTGAELLYTQDEDFTRFIPNTESDFATANGKCSLFTTEGVDVGYQAVLPSVTPEGLQQLKDKMSFPDPNPSEDFTFPEIALSVPTSGGDVCAEGIVNIGGAEYRTSIATDAQKSIPSLNYNEFRLFAESDEIKQALVTFNFKVTFTDPNNPERHCIVEPFPSASSDYLEENEEGIQCDQTTNEFCEKTNGNLAYLFEEYEKFVNRRFKSVITTFGHWLNDLPWWLRWKKSNTAFRVPTSLSIFPAGDRVCWEENPDGETFKVTVDHYANTDLGGLFGSLTESDLLGGLVDFNQQTIETFYLECEQMVNYISGVP